MSKYLTATMLTHLDIASNNRGENSGNCTTLQQVEGDGASFSIVSADCIRYGLRRQMAEDGCMLDRTWDDDTKTNVWKDAKDFDPAKYEDNDLLGYMKTKAREIEKSEDNEDAAGKDGAKKKGKTKTTPGSCQSRVSPLCITKAMSLTPFRSEIVNHFASGGVSPDNMSPTPYSEEVHRTRYQYTASVNVNSCVVKQRSFDAIRRLSIIGRVGGNHARNLFDFSAEAIVLRLTNEPAPGISGCFDGTNEAPTLNLLLRRVKCGDVKASEVVIGGLVSSNPEVQELKSLGVTVFDGVRQAVEYIEAMEKKSLTAGV